MASIGQDKLSKPEIQIALTKALAERATAADSDLRERYRRKGAVAEFRKPSPARILIGA